MLLHPHLVGRIRSDGIPHDCPESRALLALIDADGLGELPMRGGIGALIERFRGTEHETVIETLATATDENLFDTASIETLFADTLHKLHDRVLEEEFARLQQKLASDGRLSAEELQRYGELLRERRHPSSEPKPPES